MGLIGSLLDLVLDQTVRPCDANGIDGCSVCGVQQKRHAVIELPPVQISRLDLKQRVLRQLETPHAGQAYTDPAAVEIALVMHQVNTAIGVDTGAIEPAVAIEVCVNLGSVRRG